MDQVISTHVVPRLNDHRTVSLDETLVVAEELAQAQLQFALSHEDRNPEAPSKSNNTHFCALLEVEYGNGPDETMVSRALEEMRTSLRNLFKSHLFRAISRDGAHLVAQRQLGFKYADVDVACTPDLIAFFRNKPPAIVDWKVEAPRDKEHWLQLGLYSVALSRVKRHKDFPESEAAMLSDPTKIDIVEHQLLRDHEVYYTITAEDVVDIEDYVYTTALQMSQVTNGYSEDPEILIDILPTARSPTTCQLCKYRRDCWKGEAR